jgi:integrase
MAVEIDRSRWLDPRGAEMPLGTWVAGLRSLARRLAPTTQDTYRRDLDKCTLPRFAAYRIGSLPADEIENWLVDEVAAGVAPSSVHRHDRALPYLALDSGMRRGELIGLRRARLDLRNRKARVTCRFHDLRQTSVALAIAAGAHPKAIQTRMGHSPIDVTLDRCGHLFRELNEAIATTFADRLVDVQASRSTNVVHATLTS